MNSYKRIAPITKAAQVLDFLADQREPLTGRDISRALDINNNTLMCYLETLKEAHLVDEQGCGYVLGMGAAKLWSRKKAALSGEINRAQHNLCDLDGAA